MTAAQLALWLRADLTRADGLDMIASGDMVAIVDTGSDEFGVMRANYGLITRYEADGLMILPASE
jgi:hypothetical protein